MLELLEFFRFIGSSFFKGCYKDITVASPAQGSVAATKAVNDEQIA